MAKDVVRDVLGLYVFLPGDCVRNHFDNSTSLATDFFFRH